MEQRTALTSEFHESTGSLFKKKKDGPVSIFILNVQCLYTTGQRAARCLLSTICKCITENDLLVYGTSPLPKKK